MEKSVKITPPEGYEVDKEKSTFDEIVFRVLPARGLPRTYDELKTIRGYYVGGRSEIHGVITFDLPDDHVHNTWPTREEAEASIALAQLCQLRDRYNGQTGVKNCDYVVYCPCVSDEDDTHANYLLAFKTRELVMAFEKNFADLIEKAKPLLG